MHGDIEKHKANLIRIVKGGILVALLPVSFVAYGVYIAEKSGDRLVELGVPRDLSELIRYTESQNLFTGVSREFVYRCDAIRTNEIHPTLNLQTQSINLSLARYLVNHETHTESWPEVRARLSSRRSEMTNDELVHKTLNDKRTRASFIRQRNLLIIYGPYYGNINSKSFDLTLCLFGSKKPFPF